MDCRVEHVYYKHIYLKNYALDYHMDLGLIEEFEFFSRNELNPKKEIEANIVSYIYLIMCYKVHSILITN